MLHSSPLVSHASTKNRIKYIIPFIILIKSIVLFTLPILFDDFKNIYCPCRHSVNYKLSSLKSLPARGYLVFHISDKFSTMIGYGLFHYTWCISISYSFFYPHISRSYIPTETSSHFPNRVNIAMSL